MSDNVWDPDWVISPGETLRDWMEENHLTPGVVARVCGLDRHEVQRILDGQRHVTPRVANHLAAGTQIPARLWVNLERSYREGLAAGKLDASRT